MAHILDVIKRYALDVGLAAWVLLAPIHSTLAMLIALPCIDLVLGCVASWKTSQSFRLRSRGVGRTIAKVFLYISAAILSFAVDKWLLDAHPMCLDWVKMLIGFRELKSCLEHLDEIHGGSLLRSVIDKLVQKPPEGGS